ncbi:hypothetical protein VSH64_13985 [Amycolatopsis rhabdoformis]|uniref:DUF1579 domain-containing protein n=1 Tax=Amycolatopsis rhabdoformis TaxID=1448059 RepID=A0ABZ1IFH4_9PSEU|nr:hypothetical protein [Amycolatopsis rhabdoformis]WSE33211.1 hypothetical protein VSH64_13985 [Amycolatopsis rhabdoformis]
MDKGERLEALIGTWSSESAGLYHSTFEDESLVISADGLGRFQFSRPNYSDTSDFTWRTITPGQVELTWSARRVVGGGAASDQPPRSGPVLLTYAVNEEDTPLAGRRLVLRIDPAIVFAREFGPHGEASAPPDLHWAGRYPLIEPTRTACPGDLPRPGVS